MITINQESDNNGIHIQFDRVNFGYLHCYQKALIDLIRNYNYPDEGVNAQDTMHFACNILEALLPSDKQVWDSISYQERIEALEKELKETRKALKNS